MKRFAVLLVILLLASPVWGVNLKLMSDFPSGGSGGGFGGGGVSYDFRDEFSTDLAAGSVHGTLSTSGHTRTVVDTENKLSIANGALTFAGGKASPVWSDPAIWYPTTPRVAGKMLIGNVTLSSSANKSMMFGYAAAAGVGVSVAGYFVYNTDLNSYSGPYLNIDTVALGTNWYPTIILRSTGAFLMEKKGTGAFTLLYPHSTYNTANVFPTIQSYDEGFTSSFIRIPSQKFLPVPLLSTRFGS